MNRRTLLAFVSGATSGVAGCLATGGSETPPEPASSTPPATPRSTPPLNTGSHGSFDPDGTYKYVVVGSRTGVNDDFRPHDLHIWNLTPGQRVVNLRILDRLANTTAHRAAYTIPADKGLEVTLLTPSKYYVQLWGPTIDIPETLLVPCYLFDCNESSTGISIHDHGHIHSSVVSTLAGCPGYDC